MSAEEEKILKGCLVKVEGRPKSPSSEDEPTRWERFKHWLFPRWKGGKELARDFARAELGQREAEAAKRVNEAAKIAADREKTEVETDVARQEVVRKFNENVEEIFKDDGLPPAAKKLKLAKLIEQNPDLEKQLEKVHALVDELAWKRGTQIQIVSKSKKSSPGQRRRRKVRSKVLPSDEPVQNAPVNDE